MKSHASLNRIYRLVWNQTLSAWVAVAECARGRGKSSARRKLVANVAAATAALALAFSLQARAGPTDGQVVAGSGAISQAGNTTTVHQSSQNLAINWSDFSVAAHEAVRFNQPNATSIVLNRVLGQSISQIHGAISANGQVFILNPSGILFGAGAQVNVGGLVASTLSLSNDDFMANRFSFSNNGESGGIINQGTLTAAQSGYIAMLAPQVINEGVISATLGSAVMAAGNQVTLNLSRGSLVGFSIDKGAFQALVDNKQLIEADGGQVFMSAKAAEAITKAMVNNSGIIEARTLANVNGRIELISDMAQGTTNVGGILDASAPNGGDGGFIETSGAHVKIADDARITTAAPSGNTGSWLIDPYDFTVAASGGDITGAALGNLLGTNSITIQTTDDAQGTLTNLVGDPNNVGNGDIFINDAVSWSAPTILTLDAYRNIEINQPITASDSLGKLTLKYGQGDSDGVLDGTTASYSINAPVNLQAGLNFSTKLGSTGPLKEYYVITDLGAANSYTATDLQGIRDDLGGLFALGANIDASATRLWNSDLADPATYAGFEPLGFDNTAFNGEFEGLGHTISNLTINRPNQDGVGLFGNGYNNTIRNLALTNVSITGGSGVGALVGNMGYGSIFNSSASGNVSGVNNGGATGGLVGYNKLGSISHSHAAVNVVNTSSLNGDSYIAVATGGLVGLNWGGLIDRSYATGNVTSTVDVFYNGSSDINGVNKVGGLVGLNIRDSNGVDVIGLVSNSYATGRVLGNFYLSIGYNANISSVVGTNKVGGLVGDSINGNTEYSYATGAVEANTHAANYGSINSYIDINSYAGGLLGNYLAFQYSYNSVGNSYATGSVKHNVTFDNSYAVHTQSYGILSASGGLIGKLSDGMVFNSHATGAISVDGFAYADGDFLAGGLVGFNYYGNIYESYATGNLSKSRYSDEILEMGGLVGRNYGGVNQSYATGNLTNVGYGVVGGLVGFNDGNISNSYATGSVNGNGDVGGLVGYNDGGGSVSNSFWDTDTTGQNNAIGYDDGEFIGLEGLSTQEFLNKDSFITLLDDDGDPHWNFGDSPDSGTWFMIDGETRPFLQSEYSTTITNSHQLQLMAMDLDANYTLANNIDIRTAFNNISGMWVTDRTGDNPTGRGFVPLGTYGNQFGGGLDGQGYTISGLTIHRPSLNGVGLFAYGNANASISNVGVLNVNIIGANNVGALVGENRGDILNSHVSGSIVGNGVVGGLVGYNQTTGAIVGSHATVNVFSQSSIGGIGGLVGSNYGTIENSHAAGTVTGISQVGGLAGRNANQISQSYATAEVVGEQRVGGLVGRNYNGFSTSGVISESYATGVVTGGDYVGGLVGINDGATISESYATGVVTGGDYVGGLVGDNSGNITNTFATGVVRGANDVGGLVGYNNGTVTSSFWDTDTTGQADAIGSNVGTANRLVGLSTESFLNENSFTSLLDSDGDPYWTFGNSPNSGTWFMIEGETRPFLQSEYSTTITNSHQLQLMAMDLDANYTLANNIDMRTAFNNVSGMWATDRTGNSPTGSGFVPIGNENESFTGSFDGQNNTITGLSISRTNWDNPVGLFGKADADISNVGLVDVAITSGNGSYGVGGLVGYNYGQIRNSYVTGTVMGISNVGGLVGFNDYGSISNSYSTASVTGSGNDIGGLVGDNEGGNISYTFATGSVTSGDYGSGGLVGSDYNGTVSNSFWDTETTGQLSSGGGTGKTTAEMLTQATYEGWRFGDTPNSGTWFMIDGETRPFLQSEYSTTINNSHQLQLMAMDLNANYTLGNNIDMRTAFNNASGMWATDRTGNSPTGSGFVPVGNENESFTGSFDGQNNTITGLSISRTNWDNPVGLFGKADADISNVGLVDVAITSGNGSYGVGGLVGYNYGQIRNSYVTGTVMGISNVGGLVGFNDYGSISNSYSTASVMGSEDDIGGLVGYSEGGYFSRTYATGIVSGDASVGGLIGENENSSITNSHATGSVTGTNYGTGGLVGYNRSGSSITNSYASGSVSGDIDVGGFVGFNDDSSITNSYATGHVTASDSNVGGLVGHNFDGSINNTYATGSVSGGGNEGGLVGYNDSGTVENSFWDTSTSGMENGYGIGNNNGFLANGTAQTGVTGLSTEDFLNRTSFTSWNFNIALTDPSNAGTWFMIQGQTRPFLQSEYSTTITNSHQLQLMAMDLDANYTLGNNIDMSNAFNSVSGMWVTSNVSGGGFVPIGSAGDNNHFTGTLDGQGYTISGLKIYRPSTDGVGLFGYGRGISNLGLINVAITGADYVGGLAGNNYGNISNSYVTGSVSGVGDVGGLVGWTSDGSAISRSRSAATVIGSGNQVGGLVGYNQGSISNSYATGAVTGNEEVGGLVGTNDAGYVGNSYATGMVDGGNYTGGLVGYSDGRVANSYATGSVSGINNVGGLVGGSDGILSIDSSYASGNVSGTNNVGGLIGIFNDGIIDGSHANGSVSGEESVGGLAGYNNGTIRNSYAAGIVNGYDYVGGLVGSNFGTIENSHAAGTVSGLIQIGGLAGRNANQISQSYATAEVVGEQRVGGLVGRNYNGFSTSGVISESYATGVVTGGDYVGGLVGINDGATVGESYATAAVFGEDSVGGLVGMNALNGEVANSYATGVVLGEDGVGGLVGVNQANISNSYAIGAVTGDWEVGGLVGKNSGTISQTFATGQVSGVAFQGGLIGRNDGGMVNSSFWDIDTTGQHNSAVGSSKTTTELLTRSTYTDAGWTFTSGTGTWFMIDGETRPFLQSEYSTTITNSHQLQLMAMDLNANYTLANNIDMRNAFNNASSMWATDRTGDNPSGRGFVPVGSPLSVSYSGRFNGQNHTISNLIIYRPYDDSVGLFASASGNIANVGLVNASIVGDDATGGLVGRNSARVDNSFVTGSVTGVNGVGGLVGYNNGGNVTNSHAAVKVSASGDDVGGLVGGSIGADFSDNFATGSVYGAYRVGGLIGTLADGNIIDSHATGRVSGEQDVGGLVGYNAIDNSITNSHATGNVIGDLSFSYGNTVYGRVGGLVGRNEGDIRSSHATGTVTGSDYVGGLVGTNQNGASIENSYATGMVFGLGYGIGGLVGKNAGSIDNSYATGEAVGAYAVGGLVGDNGGLVENSYAIGAVSGSDYVGGLVGFNTGNISNTFATGRVQGASYLGGLIGINDSGSVENSFWDTSTTGRSNPIGSNYGSATTLIGLSTEAFLNEDNFTSATSDNGSTNAEWDFTLGSGTWFMIDGETRPFLQSEYSTTITNSHQLQLMAMDLDANYTLANNIDMRTAFNNVSGMWATDRTGDSPTGRGFVPIGNENDAFTGSFDGENHTITGLSISRSDWEDPVGLFGKANANISNIGLVDVAITGGYAGNGGYGSYGVGGLVGYNYGSISNSHVSGSVSGESKVGGLVGVNSNGSINRSYATASVSGNQKVGGLIGSNKVGLVSNSYATGSVNGDDNVGGLVGYNYGNSSIINSYATGSVIGNDDVGGLVGDNNGGTITNSYATGSVIGDDDVGGLVGDNDSASISYSYATGSVIGDDDVGGLIGDNDSSSITNSYATGNVVGDDDVGGLVGYNNDGGAIANSYATGSVNGNSDVGGLVGYNYGGSVSNSFWDTETTGQIHAIGDDSGDSGDLVGLSTQAFLNQANFTSLTTDNGDINAEWDFTPGSGTWFMIDGETRPFLQSEYSTTITNSHQLQLMAMDLDENYTLANNIDMSNAFNSVSGMWATDRTEGSPTGPGFVPIGSEGDGNHFTGTLDGQGHTISGLKIYRPSFDAVGLFGYGQGISNLGLIDVDITGGDYVGGLAGNNEGNISNSYVTGSVRGSAYVGGLVGYTSDESAISGSRSAATVFASDYDVGGLVGQNQGSISNSYATGNVTSEGNSVGGLVGYNRGAISNSYATANVMSEGNRVGGLVGYNQGIINSTFATGRVDGNSDVGGLVGINISGTVNNSFWDKDTTEQAVAIGLNQGSATTLIGLSTEDFLNQANFTSATETNNGINANWDFTLGSGTWFMIDGETRPFLQSEYSTTITNSHQLQLMAMDLDANYTLANNIDMSSDFNNVSGMWATDGIRNNPTGNGFVPIGNENESFTGSFDGQHHTITGLSISRSDWDDPVGLFGKADASISNVGLVGVAITGQSNVGGLVGYNYGSISDSHVSGSVSGESKVGGLVGVNSSGSINRSYATASVSGNEKVGGLIGVNYGGVVRDSYATGNVVSDVILSSFGYGVVATGGLVGANFAGIISNSYASGNVISSIDNPYDEGTDSAFGSSKVGGLVGANFAGIISNSYASGNVNSTVEFAYDEGTYSAFGTSKVGGLVGTNLGGFVLNSYATGNVSSTTDFAYDFQTENTVYGANKVGGLVGFNFSVPNLNSDQIGDSVALGLISNSHASGTVLGNFDLNVNPSAEIDYLAGANKVGGLVGGSLLGITNHSHATGAVKANTHISSYGVVDSLNVNSYAGGLIGNHESNFAYGIGDGFEFIESGVANSYATGSVRHSIGFYGNSNHANTYNLLSASGGLVGMLGEGVLLDTHASGAVSIDGYGLSNIAYEVGGLVGGNQADISNSYATGNVIGNLSFSYGSSGNRSVGGLVGRNEGDIRSSHATGTVTGSDYVGGLVGRNQISASIENSYATGMVFGLGDGIGGLVGKNAGSIDNSYATGEAVGAYAVGGLVGDNGGLVENSYAVGAVSGAANVGGLVGLNSGNINNTFATGNVTGSFKVGGLVGNNYGAVENSFWDTNTTGQADAIGLTENSATTLIGLSTEAFLNKDNFTSATSDNGNTNAEWDFTLGSGTWFMIDGETRPFLQSEYSTTITNSHQLQLMAMELRANYTLGNNIDMSNAFNSVSGMWATDRSGDSPIGKGFVPIGSENDQFTGSLDGQGHTISGLKIYRPSTDGVGLFGYGQRISNLGLINVDITGADYVGGLAGNNYGNISNSYVTGSVSGIGDVGGLVGWTSEDSAISRSRSAATVFGGGDDVGGLVGKNKGSISNSFATGNVTGDSDVGGLVGYNDEGSITNVYATGNVAGTGDDIGGLVGYNYGGTISNTYATGDVEGSGNVGGLVGYNISSSSISFSHATGDVLSSGQNAGALVGYNQGSFITKSYAKGNVEGSGNVGGLVGYNDNSSISFSYATGDVLSSGQSAGGLVGLAYYSYINETYATGNVTGYGDVGGLVGHNGEAGASIFGEISNSYATGSATAQDYSVGGLVGYNGGEIDQSYATGFVTGSRWLGGLVGYNDGNVTDSFWDTDTTDQHNATGNVNGVLSGLVGLSTQAFLTEDNFTSGTFENGYASPNWDFSSGSGTWFMIQDQTRPFLQSEHSTTITNSHQLQLMAMDLNANYTLANNIDMSAEFNNVSGMWATDSTTEIPTGKGFVPVANLGGSFDGKNHTITGLTVHREGTSNVGLFGQNDASISNVGLINVSITGGSTVGGLVGYNEGTISNSYVSGFVAGNDFVGGLVGSNGYSGTINRSYATASVDGIDNVGGLVGSNYGNAMITWSFATGNVLGHSNVGGLVGSNLESSISSSYATGNVDAQNDVGGLVGVNSDNATITRSFATGNVLGQSNVGGLVGANASARIMQSYATGVVMGGDYVGGLVGINNAATVSESYAIGAVTGGDYVGGLVGLNAGNISNTFASGLVQGANEVGGLVGYNDDTVSNSFWDTETTDQSISDGGTGKTTAEMLTQATYEGWRFGETPNSGTWFMIDGETRPFLQSEYSTTITNSHQLQLMAMDLTASYTLSNNIDMRTAFNNASGMWATDRTGESPTGSGFVPVGNEDDAFTGSFDGRNHTITGLTISRESTSVVGLFGQSDASISNLGLIDVEIYGGDYVGGLAGKNHGNISNSYVTGNVEGVDDVGGLIGVNYGNITNSHVAGNVEGDDDVGGLIGINYGNISNSNVVGNVDGDDDSGGLIGSNYGSISNSNFTGDVSGDDDVGGLIGINYGNISNSNVVGNVEGDDDVGGLIGDNSGVISNSFVIGYVSGDDDVGGLVGYNDGGSISRSHSTAVVTGIGDGIGGLVGDSESGSFFDTFATGNVTGMDSVGGLIGENQNGLVIKSYATGRVSGDYDVGGLVGYTYSGSTINNTYATGSVSGNQSVGGLIGNNEDTTISNSYALGNVSGLTVDEPAKDAGGLVGLNAIDGWIYNSFYDIDNVQINGTHQLTLGGIYNDQFGPWYRNNQTLNINLSEDETGSYQISSVQDLRDMLGFAQRNYSFVQTANINLADDAGLYVPYFHGNFDGKGYTISNPEIAAATNSNVGFFGDLRGNLNDVSVSNMNVSGRQNTGGLVGRVVDRFFVTNSDASGTVTGNGHNVGGLVGVNYGGITNGLANVTVSAGSSSNRIGGLVGSNDELGSINNSTANGDVAGDRDGIYGRSVGGLVGENFGIITNATAHGDVSGSYSIGGLVGYNNGQIDGSDAHGDVDGSYDDVGGLVGTNRANESRNASIRNSAAFGNVAGQDNVGGLVGANVAELMAFGNFSSMSFSSTIEASYATGSVSGNNNVGGLVGANVAELMAFANLSDMNVSSTIELSYATGAVSGNEYVGGLVGLNSSEIVTLEEGSVENTDIEARVTNSYATGAVSGNAQLGGLVGKNVDTILGNTSLESSSSNASIYASYATGNVVADAEAGDSVGGLVGFNEGLISNTYATGAVSGFINLGGLVGGGDPDLVTTSYWNTTASGQVSSSGGEGLTATAMKQVASFSAWGEGINNTGERGAVWRVYEGYSTPLLTGFMERMELNDTVLIYNGNVQTGELVVTNGTRSGTTASGTNVGNYIAYSNQQGYNIQGGRLTINPIPLAAISINGTRVYDGSLNLAASIFNLSGMLNGDTLTLSGIGTMNDRHVGVNKAVNLGTLALGDCSGVGCSGLARNYNFNGGTHTVTITQKSLNPTGLSVASSKVYDGTRNAAVIGNGSLTRVAIGSGNSADGRAYLGDTVSLTGTAIGTYNSKDVLNATTVAFSGLSLSGADANNYSLLPYADAAATITQKALNQSGLSVASSKVYDATRSAVVIGNGSLSSVAIGSGNASDGKAYLGDTVGLSGTAVGTYNSADVLDATTVAFSGLSLSGADASNYTLLAHANAAASIRQKGLTPTGLSVPISKVYDGTRSAEVTGTAGIASVAVGSGHSSDGLIYIGDTVGISGTAVGTYNDKDVADATRVVFSGLSLTGSDASNYTLLAHADAPASISQKALTQTGLSVLSSKVYDGTRNAVVIGNASLSSVAIGSGNANDGKTYLGDTVSLTGTAIGTYNSKDVLNATTVAFSGLNLGGADAGNYSLLPHDTVSATITKADAVVIANSGIRFYNGLSRSITGFSATGLVNGETVSVLSGVSAFGSGVDIGDYPVVASGMDNNYRLSFVDGLLSIVKGRPSELLYAIGAALNGLDKSDEAKAEAVVGQEADGQNQNLNEDKVKLPDDAMTSLRVSAKD